MKTKITEYFEGVETKKEHNGYFCSVGETLTIVILGTLCGLQNMSQIHQWAMNERVRGFLKEHFGMEDIPCYYWMACLLRLIKPKSLSRCFTGWAQSLLPAGGVRGQTLSFDGKSVRSMEKMWRSKGPLHIVSAHVAELGITLGQQDTDGKGKEIPAMRELIGLLDVEGCMIVADALHCQKETAKLIAEAKAGYLLNVKDNQPTLKKDIEEYVQDVALRGKMDTFATCDKNGGRIEQRTAFATCFTGWLQDREGWEGLSCIGAINTRFTTRKGTTDEWHYYISNRELSAKDLLRHARLEWTVESMHWLLDVHFREDYCRVEDADVQQSLSIVRKIALNCVRLHKAKASLKTPLSKIMFGCLLDCDKILHVLAASCGKCEKIEN